MIRLPCDQCAATGFTGHGDRHTRTRMDACRECGGTGFMPARTGETREASAPISREEWCRRFVEEMISVATFTNTPKPCDIPWREYAEEFAANVWGDQHKLMPEIVAAAEVMNWDTGDDPQ